MKHYLSVVIVVIIILSTTCLLCGCQCSEYKEAESLLASGNYEEARQIYQTLEDNGGYKDSAEKVLNSGYALANQFAANENYTEATRLFLTLGNYKESENLLSECTSHMLKNASIGDIIYYGKYEQDGNIENGSEPLTWIVLETSGDNIILLSEHVIENKPFGDLFYWEYCDVREWLNNDFLNQAFSSNEKSMI